LDLYTNLKYSLENVHTAPSDHKNLGAAFADIQKTMAYPRSMVAKIREKAISKENPESMETKSKKRQKVRKHEKRRTGEFNDARRVPDADDTEHRSL